MKNGQDYKLGELSEGFKSIEKRLDNIEKKVDALSVWRLKIVGATGAITVVISYLTTLFLR